MESGMLELERSAFGLEISEVSNGFLIGTATKLQYAVSGMIEILILFANMRRPANKPQ